MPRRTSEYYTSREISKFSLADIFGSIEEGEVTVIQLDYHANLNPIRPSLSLSFFSSFSLSQGVR
jgi:hypothetical protein